MRTETDGTLTVVMPDHNVWKQERNILHITDTESSTVNLYRGAAQWEHLATYTLDENGAVDIDMSDYIRTHNRETIVVENNQQNVCWFDYETVGLINPERAIIPENRISIPVLFGFPSAYLQAIDGVNTEFEMRNVPAGSGWESYGEGDEFEEGTNILPENISEFQYGDQQGHSGLLILRALECGKRYAAVRWVSYTGATRCHTWEVIKTKSDTSGAYELLTQDNSYNRMKGRTEGFTIRMEGLNDYDMWYYADICQSSNVEVTLDGETWDRVDILTSGKTIPDGNAGGLNTLDVELNYRRYDAVAM